MSTPLRYPVPPLDYLRCILASASVATTGLDEYHRTASPFSPTKTTSLQSLSQERRSTRRRGVRGHKVYAGRVIRLDGSTLSPCRLRFPRLMPTVSLSHSLVRWASAASMFCPRTARTLPYRLLAKAESRVMQVVTRYAASTPGVLGFGMGSLRGSWAGSQSVCMACWYPSSNSGSGSGSSTMRMGTAYVRFR